MTVQEAKRELELPRSRQERAEEMKQQIDELGSRILSAKHHKLSDTKVQASLNAHAFEDAVVKLMDRKAEYVPFRIKTEEELFEAERKVMRLMHPYNMLLFLRYLQGEGFQEAGDKLGYLKKYCGQLILEGEKLYAALPPLTGSISWNTQNDLKFYRANNLYLEYKKDKLDELSELKEELAVMIKEAGMRCDPDCDCSGFLPRLQTLREKHKAMYRKATRLKRRVEEGIAQMTDPYKEILSLHYIEGLSLAELESRLDYDYDYCQKIKSRGMKLYGK